MYDLTHYDIKAVMIFRILNTLYIELYDLSLQFQIWVIILSIDSGKANNTMIDSSI